MATQTTTSTTAPWGAQQPYLLQGFANAQNLFNQGGPQYYPGQTTVPFTQDTQDALGMMGNRARQGSPLVGAAQSSLTNTLNNGYNNPFLDSMYDRAASGVTRNFNEATMPGVNAGFASAGRYGSGLHQNAQDSARDQLGRTLGGMASNMYGSAYESERGRQMQAAGMAPQLANQDYADISQLMNAGNIQESKNFETLQSDINKFQYEQEKPYDNLARYMGFIQGNYGGQGSSSQPIYENKTGQWLGAGLGLLGALL